jgi:diacylglycerol kinase (ATP)
VLRASLNYRFPTLKVRVEDPGHEEELEGSTAFLFNLPSYALGLPFAPTARADDGLLDLLVFRRAGALQALRYLWMVVCGIHLDSEDVEHRRVGRVTLAADDPVPMQLDGDPCGHVSRASDGNPLRIEALPGVIDVLVPSAFGLSLGETAFAGHSSHPA